MSLVQKKTSDIGESLNYQSTPLRFYFGFAMVLKRKRDTSVVSRSKKSEETSPQRTDNAADNAHDLMRKYFESQFEPLDLPSKSTNDSDSEELDDDDEDDDEDMSGLEEDDWDGMSEDEDSPQVEIIEHKDAQRTDDKIDKKAYKAFMVSSQNFGIYLPGLTSSRKENYPQRSMRQTRRPSHLLQRKKRRKMRITSSTTSHYNACFANPIFWRMHPISHRLARTV